MELSDFETWCNGLAKTAYREYSRQITPVIYLWGYLDAANKYTEVRLSRDKPRWSQLVILTHVPRNIDLPALTRWFVDNLRREPILDCVPE